MKDSAQRTPKQLKLHRAARIEDAFHNFRSRRADKRGHLQTVVPYASYGSTEWVRVLGRVVWAKDPKPGSRAERKYRKREESIRGWRSFTSAPVTHAEVTVELDGQKHTVTADRGGVIDAVLPVCLPAGIHTVRMQSGRESGWSEAPVYVVSPKARFGIISDVDDTVMVTALPRPFVAAWNTFVLDEHARVPPPGMAVLLDRLARSHDEAPVFYVSTGAWNVAPTLTRFLSRNLFPAGPTLLTDWGPTHDRWFRSGLEHKRQSLARLAEEFPHVRWLLVGDDGQHDERIYREFVEQFPSQVVGVAIRLLSPGEAVLAGGRSKTLPQGGSVPWMYAANGAGLAEQLSDQGIIP